MLMKFSVNDLKNHRIFELLASRMNSMSEDQGGGRHDNVEKIYVVTVKMRGREPEPRKIFHLIGTFVALHVVLSLSN